MLESLQKVKQLSADEKDALIVSLMLQVKTQSDLITVQAAQIAELTTAHAAQIIKLQQRIKELEGLLSKNSQNSSKPPSSDGLNKPTPKSQRGSSGRRPGGQRGHTGQTLNQVENPDVVKEHKSQQCEYCHNDLENCRAIEFEARQEFEIPPAQVHVTEHRACSIICPMCRHINRGEFPAHVTQPVQYGNRAKAMMAYYSQGQFLPYKRLREMFVDIHGLEVSEGTLYNVNLAYYEKLESFEEAVKAQITTSDVLHFDESGLRVNKQLNWLHVSATDKLTYYGVHAKRGAEAINEIGILPAFKGRAVHDHWKPYLQYDCVHALCNAHHLRELKYHFEHHNQQWCDKISQFLLTTKDSVEKQKDSGKTFTSTELLALQKSYHTILTAGIKELPIISAASIRRGKQKRHPSENLWNRLSEYDMETLAFMYDFRVPFTNNQAEQDIRMNKVKQKISGCFRSFVGAQIFCRTRSYISTAKKRGVNVFDALRSVLEGMSLRLIGIKAEGAS